MVQARKGLATKHVALYLVFLNEGHSHETTEQVLVFE